ncbi:MAG: TIGR04282 family arsenosugar biosynthesis glycosyltransferase [Flavobacteriaceae bacterium]|nr:TIGR04282 family arsenosugar biosynthesis glycosyltransferase [Flavobacteriaceae bacterium]
MTKELVIVFVKNIKLGKVKTRLAKTVGNEAAFTVYSALVDITERATSQLNTDKRIYFSDAIVDSKWPLEYKNVQQGKDLGERMKNAIAQGFADGYQNIILIGSDLPTISNDIITHGFDSLKDNEVVFGPAQDGGYYLIGLTKMQHCIFENKPWSTNKLLDLTLEELKSKNIKFGLIETLNDIDTFEDLQSYPDFLKLIS